MDLVRLIGLTVEAMIVDPSYLDNIRAALYAAAMTNDKQYVFTMGELCVSMEAVVCVCVCLASG